MNNDITLQALIIQVKYLQDKIEALEKRVSKCEGLENSKFQTETFKRVNGKVISTLDKETD